MRLFKLVVTLVILGLIALFIWQNTATWLSATNFKLDLYFDFAKTAFSLQLYVVMFLSALAGFCLGVLALLKPYFKARRLLAQERQEKKQTQEAITVKETSAQAS